MQTGDVEPHGHCLAHGSNRVVGDEPELRLRLRGLDRTMGIGLDPRRDPDQNGFDPGRPRPVAFVECVEDDQSARGRRGAELLVRLVVPVEDDAVARHACSQRELELAACRDVGAEAFAGEQPQQGDVRKRLRPVHDERFGVHARVRTRTREDRFAAVDDERRSVLLRERGRTDSPHGELGPFDGRRVWKELDQLVRRVTRSTSPGPSRRRRGRCWALRQSGTPPPRRRPPSIASCPCGRELHPTV